MTKSQIVKTSDGSFTLFNRKIEEHYHSTFGAIQESEHIFIRSGLDHLKPTNNVISVLEIGFGTGLNALLTYAWACRNEKKVNYLSVEAFPLDKSLIGQLNYPEMLNIDKNIFQQMHNSLDKASTLSDYFKLEVLHEYFEIVALYPDHFDLVFFDAFSPDVQPELWSEEIFQKIAGSMKRGGLLTTYSTKGTVKRALKSAGFSIEKLAGPPGKREILRATINE